ncbi:MAG: Hsp20/alpha crystallin family protein [Deltaproteobacteria bacterium]|nr:Hsp20/alpha crystallin family protein [Deltaproteobacteria bacterium]
MAITKWSPLRELESTMERFNRLFDENIGRLRFTDEELATGTWYPSVDIYETKDEVVLKAELPGMEKKDFSIEVKDNMLMLKGERKFERETKEENYYRIERSYGTFHRSFTLPAAVDRDKIKAKYREGILEISMPKVESAKPKQVSVDIE